MLDATKHQDDKVGRLLTATAFLTAASLALANLIGGQALPRQFSVDGELLPPLALLALLVFLLCVVFGVVMLIYSVATPLTIPAFAKAEQIPIAKSEISANRPLSQIYFLPIAGVSLDEWRKKWHEQTATQLEDELGDMYVRETHNLAIRTDFKYARANEGIAILTFALLTFACAVLFAFSAAVAPCSSSSTSAPCTGSVELALGYRYALGGILFAWTFATLLTQLRSTRLPVDQLVGVLEISRGWEWIRVSAGRIFALAPSAASGWLVIAIPDWSSNTGKVPYVLLVISIIALAPTYIRRKGVKNGAEKRSVKYRAHASFWGMFVGIASAIVLAACADLMSQFKYSLGAAFTVPLGILAVALLGPTAASAERRSKHRRKQTSNDISSS